MEQLIRIPGDFCPELGISALDWSRPFHHATIWQRCDMPLFRSAPSWRRSTTSCSWGLPETGGAPLAYVVVTGELFVVALKLLVVMPFR
jgi:hypothetical protein